jgi:putative CocE/NonD family hydrolase
MLQTASATCIVLIAATLSLDLSLGVTIVAAQEASPPIYEIAMSEAVIPLPDGVRLAADIYLPSSGAAAEGAGENERFPVLLEYLPYRKNESRSRNYSLYAYFVRRGYVVARVDIRGTGRSAGRLIPYEYSDIELEDGEVVIDWLSKQSWSNGNVGMFGISWGGFNSIHMAMRSPPALKAIIAIDATDDLYQDDVHFMDGILHLDSWEMSQDLDNARPGAPDYVIDENYFRNRFDTEPWMMTYKRQQRDGPFWERTTLKANYDALRIPTFVIGGWYDGYRDSVPRMLEHVKAPMKAIVGPWSHAFPHDPYPEPGMEWRHEAVRWFDHWLKGRETGILDEPRFAVFVREWHSPGPHLPKVDGKWRWEDGWPIARVREQALYPWHDHTLSEAAPDAASHELRYVPSIGYEAGGPVMWWGDAAHDQRGTDAYSLVYDSVPLEDRLEILGLPKALLDVSATAPHANWFVRLSDVAPDGTVTQVAGAGFNGTHRNSARSPESLEPGKVFPLDIEMHFTSWVFPPGHRIRLSISNAQWPMFWPTPYPVTTSLHLGGETKVLLPVVRHEDRSVPSVPSAPSFLPPEKGPSLSGFEAIDLGTASGYGEISSVERNPQTGVVRITATNNRGRRYPWGTERETETIIHETSDAHPENTSMTGEHRTIVELDTGRVLVWEAELTFRSDRENFHYAYVRRLFENGVLLREKHWSDTIPRDFQ